MQFDMKTLYEQITLYFDHITTDIDFNWKKEIYHQRNTPIYAHIIWRDNTILSITFEVYND